MSARKPVETGRGGGPGTCRLLIDPPARGTWNMAVDEALLAVTATEGRPTLRLYQWNEPTLSLGYFQASVDRQRHPASRRAALVRRQTGGGAILHDRELTYSLTLPAGHRLSADPESLYTAVHEAFIAVLDRLFGPPLEPQLERHVLQKIRPQTKPCCEEPRLRLRGADCRQPDEEPFLCFQRESPGDLLLVDGRSDKAADPRTRRGWKILGSAQRRRRGALLQHGSLLLGTSVAAPELPGIRELSGVAISFEELSRHVPGALAEALGLRMVESRLPVAVEMTAGEFEQVKYGSKDWNSRR